MRHWGTWTWLTLIAGLLLIPGCKSEDSAPQAKKAEAEVVLPYQPVPAGEENPADNGPDDEMSLDGVTGSMGAVKFTHFTHASNAKGGYGIACRECHHTTAPGVMPEEGCKSCHPAPGKGADLAHAGPDDNLWLIGEKQNLEDVGPVVFNHFTHTSQMGYKLACKTCHHTEDLVGCQECHGHVAKQGDDGKVIPKAKRAFHTQCIECHKGFKKRKPESPAPTDCKGCHVVRKPARAPGLLSFERAQHLSCIGCHNKLRMTKPHTRAPAGDCSGCHPDGTAELPGQ